VVYLTKIADKFQQLVNLALNTTHGADNSFEKYPRLRLAPAIMSRMKTFSYVMAKNGQTFAFQPKGKPVSTKEEATELAFEEAPEEARETPLTANEAKNITASLEAKKRAISFESREEEDLAELIEVLHPAKSLPLPKREGINKWIQQAFLSNRGFELGTFNASLLATCMKKQCSKRGGHRFGFLERCHRHGPWVR